MHCLLALYHLLALLACVACLQQSPWVCALTLCPRFQGRSAFDPKLKPHLYSLADNAFNDMRYRGRDQVGSVSWLRSL